MFERLSVYMAGAVGGCMLSEMMKDGDLTYIKSCAEFSDDLLVCESYALKHPTCG